MRQRFLAALGAASLAAGTGLLTAAGLLASAAPARASTTGSYYYLQSSITSPTAGSTAHYGTATDQVVTGDWNGDRKDTLGVRRGNLFLLTNSPTGGYADISFHYGRSNDIVLMGDWNGDGKDTLGVRRGNTYYLTNGTRGGNADIVFHYGRSNDIVLVGDWNGNHKDTLAVRRGNTYYLTNGTRGGNADTVFHYGKSSDVVIKGDWNGNHKDTLAVRRGNTYYFTNGTRGGPADIVSTFGRAADTLIVGDWNGNGRDTLGVRRSTPPHSTPPGKTIPGTTGPVAVSAGLYTTTATPGCSWTRQDTSHTIIGGYEWPDGAAHVYAEVKDTDSYFASSGCGTWTEVRASDPPHLLTVGNGQYRIGFDIESGQYTAPGGSACYWERDLNFGSEPASVLDYSYGDTHPVIDLAPADVGFTSEGCGTWTPVGLPS
jgi:hypothetical protein